MSVVAERIFNKMDQVLSWMKNRRYCRDRRFGPDVSVCFHGQKIKALVLGAEGTGKSSLVRAIIGEGVDAEKEPTIYDVYEKEFKEDYGTIQVEFTVMTGKFAFPAMEKLAIKRSDVFILVYSMDRKKTMNELDRLRKVITETKNKHTTEIPLIVVGNKMDLLNSPHAQEADSNTDKAIKNWCFLHIQTSVKNGLNLGALERALIQESTFHAVTIKDKLKRKYSGSIIYRNDRP